MRFEAVERVVLLELRARALQRARSARQRRLSRAAVAHVPQCQRADPLRRRRRVGRAGTSTQYTGTCIRSAGTRIRVAHALISLWRRRRVARRRRGGGWARAGRLGAWRSVHGFGEGDKGGRRGGERRGGGVCGVEGRVVLVAVAVVAAVVVVVVVGDGLECGRRGDRGAERGRVADRGREGEREGVGARRGCSREEWG
eukprot:216109-Pleurochrysis_carterae.AAC.2